MMRRDYYYYVGFCGECIGYIGMMREIIIIMVVFFVECIGVIDDEELLLVCLF